jgi:hypothetical protein
LAVGYPVSVRADARKVAVMMLRSQAKIDALRAQAT